jgi:hypothetical protein
MIYTLTDIGNVTLEFIEQHQKLDTAATGIKLNLCMICGLQHSGSIVFLFGYRSAISRGEKRT